MTSRLIDAPPNVERSEQVAIYEAPDRLYRNVGEEEWIHVGSKFFSSHPERPGFFYMRTPAPQGEPSVFFPHLAALLEAESVVAQGSRFTFMSPVGQGEARVADGRVVTLSIKEEFGGDTFVTMHELDMFNEAPPVNAPTKDEVLPFEGVPPCDEAPTPTDDFPAVVCAPA